MKKASRPLLMMLVWINALSLLLSARIVVSAVVDAPAKGIPEQINRCELSCTTTVTEKLIMQEKTSNNSKSAGIAKNEANCDDKLIIELIDGDKTNKITLGNYLIGVVMSEIPYTFDMEAVKAQAVAARTFTLRTLDSADRHESGRVCTDSGHCSGYLSYSDYVARYGESAADSALEKVSAAVRETDGEVLTYDGELCCAVYHSASSGSTENSYNLWNTYTPYLTSVSTPEVTADETVIVSYNRAAELLSRREGYNGRSTVPKIILNDSGRCESVTLLGVTLSAQNARSVFGLKSCDFDVSCDNDGYVFTVRGYGHGIGLSQYGADTLAKEGQDYKAILLHYYSGAELELYGEYKSGK